MSLSNLGERPHAFDIESTIPDILLPEQCDHGTLTGQQKLAIALIENAVRDLNSDLFRAEALAWLHGEINDGVTFDACCEALGIEQELVLSRLGNVRRRATGYRSAQ